MLNIFKTLTALLLILIGPAPIFGNENIKERNILGGAYNEDENRPIKGKRCIKYDTKNIETINDREGQFKHFYWLDHKYLEKNIFLAIDIDNPGVPVTLGLEFLRDFTETDTSIVYTFELQASLGELVYRGSYELTDEALELIDDQDAFEQRCGDSFVNQHTLGAEIVVAVKINFHTEHEKIGFKTKLGYKKMGLLDLSWEISKLKIQDNLNLNVQIGAFQKGGYPSDLGKIFKDQAIVCDTFDTTPCSKLFIDIYDYINGDFLKPLKNYFIDQDSVVIDYPNGIPFVIDFNTFSYCRFLNKPLPKYCQDKPIIDPLLEKISYLKNLNLKETEGLKLLNDPEIFLDEEQVSSLEVYLQKIESNFKRLDKIESDCKIDPWICSSRVKNIELYLHPLENIFFDKIKNSKWHKICFFSGNSADLSQLDLILKNNNGQIENIKLYSAPRWNSKDCYKFPNWKFNFDEIEDVFIKVKSIQDTSKCKKDKTGHFIDWNLLKLEISSNKSNEIRRFEGHRFKKGLRCTKSDNKLFSTRFEKLKEYKN